MRYMLRRSFILLLCLAMLLPTFTAFATLWDDGTAMERSMQESADRWDFYGYDFESAADKPTGMSATNNVTIDDGVATFRTWFLQPSAELSVFRTSGIMRNGKHSFQFDFKFDGDDDANAVWFRPYYSGKSSLKVTVTQESIAMYREGNASVEYGYDAEQDTVIMAPITFDERLSAGTWYTVRAEKDGLCFRVKVWDRSASEPENWTGECVSASVTDADDLEDPVGFYIRCRGSGMAMDNLVMYKNTRMVMKDTIVCGVQNKNPQEVEAVFTPNIYAEDPVPPQVEFNISDGELATLSPIEGERNGNKTSLHANRLTTDADDVTVTATMDGFFGVSKVKVMDIAPGTSVEIGNRLELFLDQELLDTEDEADGITDNVTFVMHEPGKAEASDNPFPAGSHYVTVIYDEALRVYRGYYRVDGAGQRYCYVESSDGINWSRPELDICAEHAESNVIICAHTAGNVQNFEHNFSPFLDTGVPVGHSERYKAIAGYIPDTEFSAGTAEGKGLYTLVSSDGIHWTRKSSEPVISFNNDLHSHAFDSQNVAFWSEAEQQYICYFRHYKTQDNKTRTVGRATSRDFITWEDETAAFIEPNLEGEQLYTNQTAPYFRAPHIYIATAARYGLGNVVGTNPETGENYTVEEATGANLGATDVMLMSSRAGYNYYIRQFEEAFLRPGIDISDWTDRRNYPSLNLVPVGEEEISFYNLNGHRYVLRTDGFVSAHAGVGGGELLTKPVIFSDAEDLALLINVSTSVKGSLQVELQDQFGEVIPGFERANCKPITGDWIEKAVEWYGHDVSELAGSDVKVCFVMNDCDLYSYKFDTPKHAEFDDIEVIFEQGNRVIYAGTTLEELSSMITVNAVMSDGTRSALRYGDYALKGLLISGNRTVTVCCGERKVNFRVNVTKPEAVSISAVFDKGSIKNAMTLSELKECLTVTGIGDDGREFVIYPEAYTLKGKTSVGSTVVVTYKGLTTSLQVPAEINHTASMEQNLSIIDTTYVKTEAGAEAINISDRLELFLDGSLVESISGVSYKQHAPQKAPASENPFPMGAASATVIYDEAAGLYRGYYRDERLDAYCYTESTDGINWYKPALGLYTHYTEPNVILTAGDKYNIQSFEQNFSPFLDKNPNCDPAERYKALAGSIPVSDYAAGEAEGKGLYTLVSPDGIHWSRKSDEPVIVYDADLHIRAFETQNAAFWSEAEQQYVCYFRHYNNGGSMAYTVGRAVSKDFITWTDETAEFAEPNLSGEHLYNNQTAPYFRAPHIYIATATRYAAGPTDVMLMSGRAGNLSYDRQFTEAFMKAGLDKNGWTDRYNLLSANAVPTGYREMSFYHYSGDRYTLRTDGFASVHAGAVAGELITKPVVFSGTELILNFSASISGGACVELQKPDGTPYEGFEAENCVKLKGDSIAKAVQWNNADVKSLIGKPVKIRFILEDCDLYSYRFRSADEPQLKAIRASYTQDQTVYAQGSYEQLVSGLKVIAAYTDGTEREIPRDGYGFRSSMNMGTQSIQLYHETANAAFKAVISEPKPGSGSGAAPQPQPAEPGVWGFSDVKAANKYAAAVQYAASNGLMTGVTETRFGLHYAVNRATVATLLWRMENRPGVSMEMSFKDVPAGEWYTEAVRWAIANGIVTGVNSGKFAPMAEITRENLLVVLYRYAEAKNYNTSAGNGVELKFADASEVSSYAKDAVKWACGAGIIENDDAMLKPGSAVIRGDFAQIIMNFCEQVIS